MLPALLRVSFNLAMQFYFYFCLYFKDAANKASDWAKDKVNIYDII
jgi:hypothetical protein